MIPHATQPFGLCAVGLIQVKAFGLAQVEDLHRQSKFYGKLKTIASHLHGFTLYGIRGRAPHTYTGSHHSEFEDDPHNRIDSALYGV